MRGLVVYESMFGNTHEVALAIAEGIATRMDVDVIEIDQAPAVLAPDVALLVVGGPTHAHGMTTAKSRADAARRAGPRLVSRGDGVREWLDSIRPTAAPIPAATFDTRIKGPEILWGSAAKSAAKRVRELGFRLVESPRSFLVGGPTGPLYDRLVDGELERARAWGAGLADKVAEPATTR